MNKTDFSEFDDTEFETHEEYLEFKQESRDRYLELTTMHQ